MLGGALFDPPRGGGRIKEGGRIKFLPRGGPPPLSLKNAFWPKSGGGGGAYMICPWVTFCALRTVNFCTPLALNCQKDAAFSAYTWKLPAYSVAFLLTADTCSFFPYSWSFLAYTGKVRLIRALRDCKQRSSTVSKKAPTVSKKLPPC